MNLSNSAAVVAAVPHLLGFEPSDSLVLLWLDAGAVLLTARADLPEPGIEPGSAQDLVAAILPEEALKRSSALIAVVVTQDVPRLAAACVVLDQVRAATAPHRIVLLDELHLCGDRWRSLLCTDPDCCPPDGRPVSAAARADLAARFALEGRRVLPDRAAVVAQAAPVDAEIAQVQALLPADPRRSRRGDRWRDAAIAHAVRGLTGRPGTWTARSRARIMWDLCDIRVRDTVLWDLAQAEDDDLVRAALALAELTRAAPASVCGPVATCCSIAAWLTGDGALAVVAIDRALSVEPEYGLARLVDAALRAGWPPQAWRGLLADLDRQTCRIGRAIEPAQA